MAGPYLPPDALQDTLFPRGIQKDLKQNIRMIEDLYRTQMPTINYYVQDKGATSVCDAEGTVDPETILKETVVGDAGGGQWDPLWGESVPTSEETTGWEQPHGNDTHDATDSRGIFSAAIPLKARIQREAKDRELKKYGFDKVRQVLVHIPVSILDANGIQVEAGDEFEWDGERFMVLQRRRSGYWKNTNVRLYVTINADHARIQSS